MNGTLIKKDGEWHVSFVFDIKGEFEYNELPVHNPGELEDPIEGDDVTFNPMMIINEDTEDIKHYAVIRNMPQNLRDDYILSQAPVGDQRWIEGAKWMRDYIWNNVKIW